MKVVSHRKTKRRTLPRALRRVTNYGNYLANYLNRPHKGSGRDMHSCLLLLLLSFGGYLKATEKSSAKRKRAIWPDEVDREVRSRLPKEWRNRTLDGLEIGEAGPGPMPRIGRTHEGKGVPRVQSFPGGAKEWVVNFVVRFVPPAPEGSRIHVAWSADDEVSGVTAVAATLVKAGALHLVRPCSNCKQFFFGRRRDAIFCAGNCRVAHWKRTPKGRKRHAAYMRQYRDNPLVRRRSSTLTRTKRAGAESILRRLGKSPRRGR